MILHRDVVARAPFALYLGRTTEEILAWALFGGHRLIGLGSAWLAPESGGDGLPDCTA